MIYVVLFSRGLEFYVSEPNSLRVSFSQSRSFETTETTVFSRVLFSLGSSFVNKPKLKGYLYDNNIVCDLIVILENVYQNFYFELNVKLFSNFVQLTMTCRS